MTSAAFDYDTAQFDAVYRGGELLEGSGISQVPWDVTQPQPEVLRTATEGWYTGRVLDVGCGLGENAAYLSELGLDVTAVDASQTAITEARRRHKEGKVRFEAADVLALKGELGHFNSIIDSALFHALPTDKRADYARAMAENANSGASFTVITFANLPGGMPEPLSGGLTRIVEPIEAAGWSITSVHTAEYLGVAAPVETFMQKHGINPRRDPKGRNLLPVWVVRSRRS